MAVRVIKKVRANIMRVTIKMRTAIMTRIENEETSRKDETRSRARLTKRVWRFDTKSTFNKVSNML